jgi:Transglutaminase-like superfamily
MSMGRSLRIQALSNAFLFLRVFLFAAAVPHLMRIKLTRLATVIEPGWEPWPVDPDRIRKIVAYLETAIKRGRPLVRPGCLTLGLTRYYFFRRAGLDVSLHFGMGRVGREKEFVGHCWLVKEGEPYLEGQDPRPLYIEMYRISREGSRKSVPTEAIGLGRLTNS